MMKRTLIIFMLSLQFNFAHSQSQEIQQLLLNWEKLTQFKEILQDMYDGWKIIDKGYNTIKDISFGNFSLHKGFLDALMEVSPVVKKYKRVADIINYQILIVKQYKKSFQQFKEDGSFTPQELDYLGKVYSNLFNESIKNIDELFIVVTAGELRMTDDERLTMIDKIYDRIVDQFSFLQDFNSSAAYLSLQRKFERSEIEMSKKIYGY
jgi:hypothetical protein